MFDPTQTTRATIRFPPFDFLFEFIDFDSLISSEIINQILGARKDKVCTLVSVYIVCDTNLF